MVGAFLNSVSGSQESSLVEYPFHCMRYLQLVVVPQCFRIFSSSYSSSSSIRSGGGTGKLVPWVSFS